MNYFIHTTKIAHILALRMLGLFMLLPVLSPYLKNMTTNPLLIGLAVGVYGLTQSLFQIPFGYASDKFGRKKIIALGLSIFVLGSFLCAASSHIYGMIIGRALQGSGAIGSSAIAFLSDLTTEQQRAKAMAIVGVTIGLSFSVALLLGPLLHIFFTVPSIFYFSSCFGIIALLILFSLPNQISVRPLTTLNFFTALFQALRNQKLLFCYISICLLHAFLTSLFIIIPMLLAISQTQQGYFYFGLLLGAISLLIPLFWLEKKYAKLTFVFTLLLIASSQIILLVFQPNLLTIALALLFFLAGFNFLEAYLPSLISQFAPIDQKGTTLGIFSTCQFLGIFLGGIWSGLILSHLPLKTIFLIHTLIACIWIAIAARIRLPICKYK